MHILMLCNNTMAQKIKQMSFQIIFVNPRAQGCSYIMLMANLKKHIRKFIFAIYKPFYRSIIFNILYLTLYKEYN